MSDMESELTAEFSQPLVFTEGPKSRVQLTLTPWEVRELVRRAIKWHLHRIELLGEKMGAAPR